MAAQLQQLLSVLHIDAASSAGLPLSAQLAAASARLNQQVLPALAQRQQQGEDALSLDALPLGFETGGACA